jgi:hypothetical protein
MKMYVFKNGGGKPEKHDIPDNERERAEALHKSWLKRPRRMMRS